MPTQEAMVFSARNRPLVAFLGLLLPGLFQGGPARAEDVVEYVVTDALGNIRAIEDEQGNVIERHDYLPFGEECTTSPCAANPGVGAGQPRKFTGKERDPETGLDYFGARYYRATTARFTTVDPVYTWQENLVDPQRWNRYAYARNNPYRYVDPDGKAILPAIAIAWAVYEVGSQIYDAYTAYQTVTDPTATTGEKATAIGGFAVGAIAPGGGYGTAGTAVLGKADEVADAARALKNARQRGVARAKAAEQELVESGHPGTVEGGWSWSERKQIAETGQFPSDTRWHHVNDVKRNPALADNPTNVIPARGGNAGHVRGYHPQGTRAGSSGPTVDRADLVKKQYGE